MSVMDPEPNLDEFKKEFAAHHSEEDNRLLQRMMQWSDEMGLVPRVHRSNKVGMQWTPRMPGRDGNAGWLFGVQTQSRRPVVMQLGKLAGWSPPFSDNASLQELRGLLDALPGVTWEPHSDHPMTTLSDLARPGTLDLFLAVLEWAMGEVARAG
jgi:hypothetical protein